MLCCFSHLNTAAHGLHFQHLMWTRGYEFKTSTVKRSLVSIFILTSNEHILDKIMVKNLGLTIHLTWLIMVYLTLVPLL